MMAESYHRSFGLPVAIMRPFNTYGPQPVGQGGDSNHPQPAAFRRHRTQAWARSPPPGISTMCSTRWAASWRWGKCKEGRGPGAERGFGTRNNHRRLGRTTHPDQRRKKAEIVCEQARLQPQGQRGGAASLRRLPGQKAVSRLGTEIHPGAGPGSHRQMGGPKP